MAEHSLATLPHWLLAAFFADGEAPPLADAARITENDRELTAGETALSGATRLGQYRIAAHDESSGQSALCGQMWFGDVAAVCGVRIRCDGGRISEVEIIRSPSRFPGSTGVEASELGAVRPPFGRIVPLERRLSRERLVAIAGGYYEAVNLERPELARLEPNGARIEAGTQITGNPAFRFDFYQGLDGQALPNFGEWTAREQFERGLWNADLVPEVRFPVVEPRYGLVFAFMTYCPWGKRAEVDVVGVGRVGPAGDPARRVALNAMEVFRIDHDRIEEMESVWSIEPGGYRNSWCRR